MKQNFTFGCGIKYDLDMFLTSFAKYTDQHHVSVA